MIQIFHGTSKEAEVFDKYSKERQLFADYYKLCGKWWIPPEGDSYEDKKWWDEMWTETDEFRKKYHDEGNRFAEDMVMALRDRLKDKTTTQVRMDV